MSRNPRGSEPHRFAVEELNHPLVRRPNNQAPQGRELEPVAGKTRICARNAIKEETRARKPCSRPPWRPACRERKVNSYA